MTPAEVTSLVDGALRAVRARCGPELHGAFDALMDRHGWLRGDDPEYYVGVNSQPVLVLPLWLAGRHHPPADVLADLLAASWLGYAAVRVQDDHMDEGLGEPVATMFLGQAFFAAHQAGIARIVGPDPAYWEAHQQVWADYGAAMLMERRLLDPSATLGAEEYDAILRRSLPLLLPSAALLHRLGLRDQLEDLRTLVFHAVRAAQLFNDAMDACDDLAGGRHTWIVRRFGGAEGAGPMMKRLVLGGGIEELFAESSADLDHARAAALRMGLDDAADWIDRRKAMMKGAIDAALAALFQRLLSGAAPT